MNTIVFSAAIVGMLFIMFYIPYLLAKGVSQMAYGKKLEPAIVVRCWVPVYNIFYADSQYFGKLSFASYGFLAMVVCTILRVAQWYYMYDNDILARIFISLFYLSIVVWYLLNCTTSFIIMHESGVVSVGKALLFSVIFPFGYFYIGQFLANVIAHNMAERSDKSWDDGEDDEL